MGKLPVLWLQQASLRSDKGISEKTRANSARRSILKYFVTFSRNDRFKSRRHPKRERPAKHPKTSHPTVDDGSPIETRSGEVPRITWVLLTIERDGVYGT